MKSKTNPYRHFLECNCTSPDCFLCFDYDGKDWNTITVSFRYDKFQSFFGRIKSAWNYIFKKEDLYMKDIVINTNDLEEFLEEIVEIKNKHKENSNEKK